MTTSYDLACHVRGTVAQRTALRAVPDAVEALLSNTHLVPEVWWTIAHGPKLSASQAKQLVARCRDWAQVDHVLATEKRTSVLAQLFDGRPPAADWIADPRIRAALRPERQDKSVARNFGHCLDIDALAAHPGDQFGPHLRTWRLTSSALSDDQVLAELSTHDEWGTPYLQAPIGLALTMRPGLVVQLAEVAEKLSTPLRTVLAGSAYFGDLTPDQQRRVLDLGRPAGSRTIVELSSISAAWMAAGANRTTSHTIIADILSDAEHVPMDPDSGILASESIAGRLERNWSVESLRDPMTPDQLAVVTKWAAGRNRKVRLDAVLDLLGNPGFTSADAFVVAIRLRDVVDQFADGANPVQTPFGRAVLAAFGEAQPEAADEAGLRVPEETASHDAAWNVDPSTELDHADLPRHQAAFHALRRPEIVALLEEAVSADEATWTLVYTMSDTLGSTAIGEFIDLCTAVACG